MDSAVRALKLPYVATMSLRKDAAGNLISDQQQDFDFVEVFYTKIGKRKLWSVFSSQNIQQANGTTLKDAMRIMSIKLEFYSYKIAERAMWTSEAMATGLE